MTSRFDDEPFVLSAVVTIVGFAEPPVSETLVKVSIDELPCCELVSQ
jgi:hypothetical protein